MRIESKNYNMTLSNFLQVWWKKSFGIVRSPKAHRLIEPAKVWSNGDQEWFEEGRLVKGRYRQESWDVG